jgi:hypothetical protein
MSQSSRYRVFISFQMENLNHANLIDAWSANENDDFEMYNERLRVAVNSTQADYVKSRIRPRIDRASVLLCLIGATTYKSSWVDWEITYAKSKSKGLVGMMLQPQNTKPSAIVNAGAVFVPYDQDEIAKAVDWAATARASSGDYSYN